MGNRVRNPLSLSANLGSFQNFSEAWLACLRHIISNGCEVMDGQERLMEVLNVSLSAGDCSVDELIVAGADEVRLRLMLLKYRSLTVLPQYKISYGRLFRNHCGVDQVRWLIDHLNRNPDSKSATVGFHIPGSGELSCISLLDCKIRDGALHLNAVFRSQNVYASQPGNACALRDLQREIAERLQVPVGFLTLHIMSAHIYQNDWRMAHETISRNGCSAPVEPAGAVVYINPPSGGIARGGG